MAASPPARAENHGAVSAYDKAAYDGALREFQALARGDDTAAQYYLALMFKDGLGVEADPMGVLGWFICAEPPGGQAGTGAANWTEQLSSSPDDSTTSTAQEGAMRCHVMAAPPPTRAAYRAAVSAHDRGREHDAALREFQALTRDSGAAAQYDLALIFKGGLGNPADTMVAVGWYICAAGSGSPVGTDALHWIEQLSSSLDDATTSTTTASTHLCRVTQDAERLDVSETIEPAGYRKFSNMERPDVTLDKLFAGSSQVESARPKGGISLDWNRTSEPSKSESGSFFATPYRDSLWSKAFFSPADGTIYGSQKVAWKIGANDLYQDLNSVARNDNRIFLGALAALWWFLIGKTLFSFGRVLVSVFRGFGAK